MKNFKGFLCVFFCAVFWGSAGLFVRPLRALGIESIQIVLARALFTIILLALIILIKNPCLFKIKLKDLYLFVACGIVSVSFFNYFYYQTMEYTSLSVAAVLMYTAPIFVMIISAIFFREKFSVMNIVCCLFAVVGCALVSGVFNGAQKISAIGLIYGILTGFFYSLLGIFTKLLVNKGYNSFTINFYSFVFTFSAILCITNPVKATEAFTTDKSSILIIVAMAVFDTVIPYILYSKGLEILKPSTAIIIACIEPVAATVIDIVFFKTIPDIYGFIGMALVLCSVLIINLKSGNKENEDKNCCKDKLNA